MFTFSTILFGQGYQFTEKINLETSPVINQGRTGTCWSFSTSSFLESEIMRMSGKEIDLSEMYNVRYTYPAKAENYLMRQGKAQFSEGGLAHDVINSVTAYGLVPYNAYTGIPSGEEMHNHSKMVEVLEKMLNDYNEKPAGTLDPGWRSDVDSVLDHYMGAAPETFIYQEKEYTPQSFLKMTGLDPDDYLTITSFSHEPFYTDFILNIPDNFSNGSMYNVPLDEMMEVIDHALKNGYTVELDCDVSEPTFSASAGVAVIPVEKSMNEKALEKPVSEMEVSQEYRQKLFENQSTTDDHLMHITGIIEDQNGTRYYKVKNSWGTGERVNHGGYVYMSEAYMRLKTISVMVHKDALPKSTARALKS